MELAKTLKTLRIENNLTQQELSNHLKIGQATIACYENGQREPHISILLAYADYFECSIDYLLGRTDDLGNIIIGEEKTRSGLKSFTNDEIAILDKYRLLSYEQKIKLSGYIDGLTAKKT